MTNHHKLCFFCHLLDQFTITQRLNHPMAHPPHQEYKMVQDSPNNANTNEIAVKVFSPPITYE